MARLEDMIFNLSVMVDITCDDPLALQPLCLHDLLLEHLWSDYVE